MYLKGEGGGGGAKSFMGHRNGLPYPRDPTPEILNPKPETLIPKPYRNPKP